MGTSSSFYTPPSEPFGEDERISEDSSLNLLPDTFNQHQVYIFDRLSPLPIKSRDNSTLAIVSGQCDNIIPLESKSEEFRNTFLQLSEDSTGTDFFDSTMTVENTSVLSSVLENITTATSIYVEPIPEVERTSAVFSIPLGSPKFGYFYPVNEDPNHGLEQNLSSAPMQHRLVSLASSGNSISRTTPRVLNRARSASRSSSKSVWSSRSLSSLNSKSISFSSFENSNLLAPICGDAQINCKKHPIKIIQTENQQIAREIPPSIKIQNLKDAINFSDAQNQAHPRRLTNYIDNQNIHENQYSTNHVEEDGSHRVIQTDPSGRYECWDICIGKGAYKEVYKAFDNEEGVEVAWNQLRAETIPSRDVAKVYDEVKMLSSLKHENIINFFDVWTAKGPDGRNRVYFITELMSSGNLKSYIRKTKGPLKTKVVRNLCRHIVRGLVYLHSHDPPIIHRDLKCDNIFINGNNGVAKIGDLGLATAKNKEHISSVLGTPEFMAPELYDEKYDERVDIYAFGMCVLELVTKEYPYQECINQAQIFKRVSAGILPDALEKITDQETREFVEYCIRHNHHERPSASDLIAHPFLTLELPTNTQNQLIQLSQQTQLQKCEISHLLLPTSTMTSLESCKDRALQPEFHLDAKNNQISFSVKADLMDVNDKNSQRTPVSNLANQVLQLVKPEPSLQPFTSLQNLVVKDESKNQNIPSVQTFDCIQNEEAFQQTTSKQDTTFSSLIHPNLPFSAQEQYKTSNCNTESLQIDRIFNENEHPECENTNSLYLESNQGLKGTLQLDQIENRLRSYIHTPNSDQMQQQNIISDQSLDLQIPLNQNQNSVNNSSYYPHIQSQFFQVQNHTERQPSLSAEQAEKSSISQNFQQSSQYGLQPQQLDIQNYQSIIMHGNQQAQSTLQEIVQQQNQISHSQQQFLLQQQQAILASQHSLQKSLQAIRISNGQESFHNKDFLQHFPCSQHPSIVALPQQQLMQNAQMPRGLKESENQKNVTIQHVQYQMPIQHVHQLQQQTMLPFVQQGQHGVLQVVSAPQQQSQVVSRGNSYHNATQTQFDLDHTRIQQLRAIPPTVLLQPIQSNQQQNPNYHRFQMSQISLGSQQKQNQELQIPAQKLNFQNDIVNAQLQNNHTINQQLTTPLNIFSQNQRAEAPLTTASISSKTQDSLVANPQNQNQHQASYSSQYNQLNSLADSFGYKNGCQGNSQFSVVPQYQNTDQNHKLEPSSLLDDSQDIEAKLLPAVMISSNTTGGSSSIVSPGHISLNQLALDQAQSAKSAAFMISTPPKSLIDPDKVKEVFVESLLLENSSCIPNTNVLQETQKATITKSMEVFSDVSGIVSISFPATCKISTTQPSPHSVPTHFGFNLSINLIGIEVENMQLNLRMTIDTLQPDGSSSAQDVNFPFHVTEDTIASIVSEMIREGVLRELTEQERTKIEKMMDEEIYGPKLSTLVDESNFSEKEKFNWLKFLKTERIPLSKPKDIIEINQQSLLEPNVVIIPAIRSSPIAESDFQQLNGRISAHLPQTPSHHKEVKEQKNSLTTPPLNLTTSPLATILERPSLLIFEPLPNSLKHENLSATLPSSINQGNSTESRLLFSQTSDNQVFENFRQNLTEQKALAEKEINVAESNISTGTIPSHILPKNNSVGVRESFDEISLNASKVSPTKSLDCKNDFLIDVDTVSDQTNSINASPVQITTRILPFGEDKNINSGQIEGELFCIKKENVHDLASLNQQQEIMMPKILGNPNAENINSTRLTDFQADLLFMGEDESCVLLSQESAQTSPPISVSFITPHVTPTSSKGMSLLSTVRSGGSMSPTSIFGIHPPSREELQRTFTELQTQAISEFDRNEKQNQQLMQQNDKDQIQLHRRNSNNHQPTQQKNQQPHISMLEMQQQQQRQNEKLYIETLPAQGSSIIPTDNNIGVILPSASAITTPTSNFSQNLSEN